MVADFNNRVVFIVKILLALWHIRLRARLFPERVKIECRSVNLDFMFNYGLHQLNDIYG